MAIIEPIHFEALPALNALYNELTGRYADKNKLEAAYAGIAADSRYILLGAYVDGELLGSLMGIVCQDLVGDCRPFMVIENVVVSSRARRQGLGKELMEAIEAEARERDCYYIIFVSGGQRKEAHRFYESLGYKEEQVEGYRKHLASPQT